MVNIQQQPRLVSLATAVPPHVLRQGDVELLAKGLFEDALEGGASLMKVFGHAQIDQRNVSAPLEWFSKEHSFGEKNDLYLVQAEALAFEATQLALSRAGLLARDIDRVVFVSSTGLATPTVDARLANTMDFRPDVRRTPIWGLGCSGGAAGLAHARDLARADPTARVLLVAVELCSLTFQRHDLSKRNLVAASIFGDGAAAAIIVGSEVVPCKGDGRRPLRLVASRSMLWKDTLDVMGWGVDGDGLHVVFSRDIPTIVHEKLRPSMASFLAECGLGFEDLDHIAVHPGGAKVLRAYADALGLAPPAFRHAREVLRDHGNMSSPSCLFVLDRFLEAGEIAAGDTAIIAALGPGFCAEYVLAEGDAG
ncbi:MAG: 3-oxoacyl-[acyl-carrier-protein] synthase III C-terminal domain-containing protein [Candidatus Eisenbacteria bacterium]